MSKTVSLLCLISTLALVQPQMIDENVLSDIFGTPPPAKVSTSVPALEDITVKPTNSPTTLTNKEGEECKCVPYYLCDEELNGVNTNNATVTGWGELDIRLGEGHECQESVERCCKNPKEPSEIPVTTTASAIMTGCGHRNTGGLDFTVTGGSGSEAGFGEYPWVVALLSADNGSYIGVGVLIHPSVVLTCAHVAIKASAIRIRAGEWDTQTVKERLPHQERLTQEIIIHEDFRSKSLWNDVALLRLAEPLTLDLHVNTICLPQRDQSFDQSKNCVANGWGKKIFGQPGRYAVILKRVEQDMVPAGRCQQLLRHTRLGPRFHLHGSFTCAGGEEGKDTCQGDGGAPLACPDASGRHALAGLVAWGIGCGQRDVPAVYVHVPPFRPWIDAQMAEWNFDTLSYEI